MARMNRIRRVPIVASMAALLAAVIGVAGLILPSVAQAAEVDAVTGVTVIDPAEGVTVFDTLTLEATWAAPASAQPGDTFSLDFPTTPLLVGIASTFDLKAPDGSVIGTCVVSPEGIECTFSDYVATHTNVRGTLEFQARVMQETTQGELPFTTGGGGVIMTPIPGGGVNPGTSQPVPADAVKSGVVTTKGDAIEWSVWVPGTKLVGPTPTLTDTYTPGLTFLSDTLTVGSVNVADWNGGNFTAGSFAKLSTPEGYVLTEDAAASTFTVGLVEAVQPDRLYRLMYQTKLPAGVKTGDVFDNTVTGSGFTETTSTVKVTRASGGGVGDGLGDFSVAKAVTGAAAASVPADRTFVVDYSYTLGGNAVTGSLTLTAGGAAQSVADLPVGTVVTVKERPAASVDGVIWGTPQFSGAGVRQIDGGAELTIDDGAAISVTVTNPAEPVPPVLGGFSVAKTVSGEAAASVPATQAFVVDYSYAVDGAPVTGSLTLTPGGAAQSVDGIPAGTVVSVKERPATAVEGVIWGAPQFGGAGVRPVDGGAELTIGEGGAVAVALTNPANTVPPVRGGFSIAKQVTGAAAGAVPADQTFEVEYSYEQDGTRKSGVVTVRANGEAQIVDGIPAGTVVSIEELTPASVKGVTWGAPRYTGEGVTATSDGAELTIVDGANVGLIVVNPATPVPPVPSDPPVPPVPPVPSVPATPAGGTTLAITGGAGAGAVALGALALAGIGVGLLLLRRRRQAPVE